MDSKRNDPNGMTEHHRKPKKLGGTDAPKNISRITRVKHTSWHTLFNHMEAQEIAHEINRHYLDPDYEMVAIKKSLKVQ